MTADDEKREREPMTRMRLAGRRIVLIPRLADQNRCAQPHAPMNIVRQS